jgi:hypothetical protein
MVIGKRAHGMRPIRIYAKQGRNNPLRYLATTTSATSPRDAVARFAAQSLSYDVTDLKAVWA